MNRTVWLRLAIVILGFVGSYVAVIFAATQFIHIPEAVVAIGGLALGWAIGGVGAAWALKAASW